MRKVAVFLVLFVLLFPLVVAAAEQPFPDRELVELARRYHLPMPPKGSRLVLAHTETWTVLGNRSTSREPANYSDAFLLKEMTNGSILVLRGVEQQWLDHNYKDEPLWRPFSDEVIKPVLGGYVSQFDRTSAFVCAVQLAATGDNARAQAIWRRVQTSEWLADADPHEPVQLELKNPSLLLAKAIYRFLKDSALDAPGKWPEIYDRMKALFVEFPTLSEEPNHMAVLDGLSAALAAKEPLANSTEALLVSWSRIPRDKNDPSRVRESVSGDGLKAQIILRGADAVPGLIELMDDQRITTHEFPAVMNSPPRVRLLGELARDLLDAITAVRAESPGKRIDAATYRSWLEESHRVGEEKMLARSLFTREGGKITQVSESIAMILAEKFPEALPSLCEEFSRDAKPNTQPFALAEAVVGSKLPSTTKIDVLAGFAERGSLEHKRAVLQCLAPLDPGKCSAILLPIIQKLPADAAGPCWTCPEAALTHVVMLLENDEIWRAYLRAAKRSSVGLRMEMMNPMDYDYITNTNRARRLAFLAAFLDDTSVRVMPKNEEHSKFSGPCAAFTFERITVRDFVADEIACILNLPDYPDEFWTSAQWGALRDKVRRKLAKERLPRF